MRIARSVFGKGYTTRPSATAYADTDPGNYHTVIVVPGTYRNDFPEVTRLMTIQVDPAFPRDPHGDGPYGDGPSPNQN